MLDSLHFPFKYITKPANEGNAGTKSLDWRKSSDNGSHNCIVNDLGKKLSCDFAIKL